jgi:hypothetical protein
MDDAVAESLPAPQINWPPAETKWERERRAFHRLLPSLLATHRGKFVAIHEERIVDSGDDKVALALRAYAKFGYVPVFVSLVTDVPQQPVRIPSPRVLRD